MGIRAKILLAFGVCFGLMAAVSLALLKVSVHENYGAIERRDLISSMSRVLFSAQAGLMNLKSQTRDWAEWTDMYDYVRDPNGKAGWLQENLTPESLQSVDLSIVLIFDAKARLLTRIERLNAGQKLTIPAQFERGYEAVYRTSPKVPACGIVTTNQGLLSACWATITRSDFTGELAGTMLMGRLLSPGRVASLQTQSGLPFELVATSQMPHGLTFWPGTLPATVLGGTGFWSSHDADAYQLYYPVQDVLHNQVGLISLNVPREVHAQGLSLFAQVRQQLAWSALLMAILLGVALHVLLVSRLRRFSSQLLALTKRSAWSERIDVAGHDELGLLSREVNSMLELIENQMSSLTALSMTDTLTGLANRRAFDARLAMELPRERRYHRSLALLVIDVDYFKRYNDRYGHPKGDAALQALGAVLRQACSRATDLPARIGGEEFAVLLPETDATEATTLAGLIQTLLTQCNIAHEDSEVAPWLSVSIGIAIACNESPASLMQRADAALYQAKGQGRNCAFCSDTEVARALPVDA
jgi:diguanylate cyclase (GGDEF)-like protein